MRVRARLAALAVLALLALPGLVAAQVRPSPPRPQPGQPGQQRQLPGQPARDTVPVDTTIQWSEPDSIMKALLAKRGYTPTRYEGEMVAFDAASRALLIAAGAAKNAMVERDSMRARSDTQIVYDEQRNTVSLGGRFNIVTGPGQAPVEGRGTATYNLARRTGRLTNAMTTVDESDERWFIRSEISIPVLGDSARGIQPRFYGVGGTLTSCDDSIPDYHFRLREIKRTQKTLVARPAVLYISDIPVMWLPFVFQDIRPGRRSGILPPSFGASDIVRNNPNYRRHIENLGYYWAISDYLDFASWMNWRSSAGADSTDPGWVELNGQMKYSWLTRFLTGEIAAAAMRERTGNDKLSVYWRHQQRLGVNRTFSSNLNYTTSTTLQRRNTFVPASAIATVVSTLAFSDKYGPASIQIGGTQRQFPGRKQLERAAPSITVSSTPIAAGEWLLWTPSFSFSEAATLHIDQPAQFSTRLIAGPNGEVISSDSLDRNQYMRNMTIGSPLRLFGLDLSQQVSIRDEYANYPVEVTVYPNADSARKELRVFPESYRTTVDWNPTFSLPPIFQNRFRITPSVTLSNVDPRPFWVRSVTTGGRYVHQSKRLSYGLSAAPTIFGLWPGFGPFQRFRHSLSPTISYSFAPPAKVSRDYLEAFNEPFDTYLGSLRQNAISLGLSQNVEAKVRLRGDTTSEEGGQKL
ncbi:MAG: putative LPS assembly protein LptD, partial [Gemmatimonadaceae bacterium]